MADVREGQIRVIGIDALQKKLGRIQDPKRNKAAIRATVTAGMTVLRKEMKSLLKAHFRTGSLDDAVRSKVKVFSSGVVFGVVGPQRGAGLSYHSARWGTIIPIKYWHLLDRGTKPHVVPDAHRAVTVNGRRVLVNVGPKMHPGSRAARIQERTAMRGRSRANAAMVKRYRQRLLKEATRNA